MTWIRPLGGPCVHYHPEAPAHSACFAPHLLPVPLCQPHSPQTLTSSTSQGAGERKELPRLHTPKPERARQRQLLQMCLPYPAHVGGQGWDWGLVPSFQLCSLSAVVRGLPSDQRKNSEMSCLFVFVTKLPLPTPWCMASFSLVYFSHCKFLVQTQRKKLKKFLIFKKKVSVLDKDCGNLFDPPPAALLFAGYSPTPHGGLWGRKSTARGPQQEMVSLSLRNEKRLPSCSCMEHCLGLGGGCSDCLRAISESPCPPVLGRIKGAS